MWEACSWPPAKLRRTSRRTLPRSSRRPPPAPWASFGTGPVGPGGGRLSAAALPGAPEAVIAALETGIQRRGRHGHARCGKKPEEILTAVCPGMQLEFLETTEVAYRCYCSRERVVGALISLGRKELEEIAQAGQTVHIGCLATRTIGSSRKILELLLKFRISPEI